MASHSHFLDTSGANDPVWVHLEPYSNRPHYEKLNEDITTDVCVIGSGIAGVSVSYELVTRGVKVVMLEAREILSGESGNPCSSTSEAHSSLIDDKGVQAVT